MSQLRKFLKSEIGSIGQTQQKSPASFLSWGFEGASQPGKFNLFGATHSGKSNYTADFHT
jgi:hypothetical protein